MKSPMEPTVSTQPPTQRYEPPQLVVLGRLEELTLQFPSPPPPPNAPPGYPWPPQ
jgi:hypothetical protein